MSIIPNAYLRNERLASAQVQATMQGAKENIEVAKAKARQHFGLALRMLSDAVNSELGCVPDQRARVTAFANMDLAMDQADDILNDLCHGALDLLSREAGEE